MFRRLRRYTIPRKRPADLTVSPVCRVVRNRIDGQWIHFIVRDPGDTIQREHIRGRFYEPDELDIIRRHMPENAVFCDIGANIGNHSIFVLKYLGAQQAILFEPNPDAIEMLRTNIALNDLAPRCDMAHLGFGLSDSEKSGLSVEADDRNLGSARMIEGGGTLELRTGDTMLGGRSVDFIKIDVEGMEMAVLGGLAETIARNRPTLFIEVDNENAEAFQAWVAANGYDIRERFRRYEANENFLLTSA